MSYNPQTSQLPTASTITLTSQTVQNGQATEKLWQIGFSDVKPFTNTLHTSTGYLEFLSCSDKGRIKNQLEHTEL